VDYPTNPGSRESVQPSKQVCRLGCLGVSGRLEKHVFGTLGMLPICNRSGLEEQNFFRKFLRNFVPEGGILQPG